MKATVVLPDKAIVAGGVGWDAVQLIGKAWCRDGEAHERLLRPRFGDIATWGHYANSDGETLWLTTYPDLRQHATVYEIEASPGLVPAARVPQSALMFAAAGPTFAEQAASARALIAAGQALKGEPTRIGRQALESERTLTDEEWAISRALRHLWNGLIVEGWTYFEPVVAEYAQMCQARAREAQGPEYVALMPWPALPVGPLEDDPSRFGPMIRSVRLSP